MDGDLRLHKKEENSSELSSFVQSCKFVTDYRTISSSQTGREKLVSSMPWREIVGEANFSSSQTGREKLVSSMPWREIVGEANNFMKDFLKVVGFVHYLKADGYDMVTFDKVGNGIKS